MSTDDLTGVTQQNQKQDIYNEMAQMLCGYDTNGNINKFDASGSFSATPSKKMGQVYFLNIARLLTKDEIQKQAGGGFTLSFNIDSTFDVPQTTCCSIQFERCHNKRC